MDDGNPTVWEDLGYNSQKSGVVMPFQKYQKLRDNATLKESGSLREGSVRIEYIRGMMTGSVVVMDKRYADPVTQRGYAREVVVM